MRKDSVVCAYTTSPGAGFAEFSVSTQRIFLLIRSSIDSTFCGILVCGPLQFESHFFPKKIAQGGKKSSRPVKQLTRCHLIQGHPLTVSS